MKKLLVILLLPFLLVANENSHVNYKANDFLTRIFHNNFHFSNLEGGYSEAANFLVEKDRKYYVLKMHQIDESFAKLQKEQFAMQEAAKIGVSPKVHYISQDRKSILMDYITGRPWSIAQAKTADACQKVAALLRKVHATSINPYENENYKSKAEYIYKVLSFMPHHRTESSDAIQLIRKVQKELSALNFPKTNIHGDLNPGNILSGPQNLYLIDWYETAVEDPFYDLSSFAIFHGLNQKEEMQLLCYYLQETPSNSQKKHYYLTKQINLGLVSLTYYYVSAESRENYYKNAHIRDWPFYANALAMKNQNLSGQFFYEAATRALLEAKGLEAQSFYF